MLSADQIITLLFDRTAAGVMVVVGLTALISLLALRAPLHRRIAAVALFVCAFSVYDVFGYDFIVMTDSTADSSMTALPALRDAYAVSLNAYRIVQVTFQFILSAAVLFAAGWRATLAANLVWMGAGCDLLYYAATFRPIPSHWDWLWFTPLGWFFDSLSLPVVLVQFALLGVAAALLISPLSCRLLPSERRSSPC